MSARLAHVGLYLLMFATTVVGWALAGTMRTPMDKDVFGLTFPAIVGDKSLHRALEDAHKCLAYVLACPRGGAHPRARSGTTSSRRTTCCAG